MKYRAWVKSAHEHAMSSTCTHTMKIEFMTLHWSSSNLSGFQSNLIECFHFGGAVCQKSQELSHCVCFFFVGGKKLLEVIERMLNTETKWLQVGTTADTHDGDCFVLSSKRRVFKSWRNMLTLRGLRVGWLPRGTIFPKLFGQIVSDWLAHPKCPQIQLCVWMIICRCVPCNRLSASSRFTLPAAQRQLESDPAHTPTSWGPVLHDNVWNENNWTGFWVSLCSTPLRFCSMTSFHVHPLWRSGLNLCSFSTVPVVPETSCFPTCVGALPWWRLNWLSHGMT